MGRPTDAPLTELIAGRHGESEGNIARETASAEQAETITIGLRDPDVPLGPPGPGAGRGRGAPAGRRVRHRRHGHLVLAIPSGPADGAARSRRGRYRAADPGGRAAARSRARHPRPAGQPRRRGPLPAGGPAAPLARQAPLPAVAGSVAGLFARGADPARAACWATYLRSTAGDRLAAPGRPARLSGPRTRRPATVRDRGDRSLICPVCRRGAVGNRNDPIRGPIPCPGSARGRVRIPPPRRSGGPTSSSPPASVR